MRQAGRSPGPFSSFFVHNTSLTLRLLSCSHTEQCEQGAASCCLDVAAFHRKRGTRWECRESDHAMFKFNLSGREMKGPRHWERAFLFPSDTLFRFGRAPRKDFKYERPLFLKTQFWLISEGLYGFLWAWITGFTTSPFVSFTSKWIQKLLQYF